MNKMLLKIGKFGLYKILPVVVAWAAIHYTFAFLGLDSVSAKVVGTAVQTIDPVLESVNAHPQAKYVLFGAFGVIVVLFMVLDLYYFNRKAHEPSTKAAALQTLFWIAIACIYGVLIGRLIGRDAMGVYFSAYVTEKMLSVDNLFVISQIFKTFKIKAEYQHRILFWGIIGAVVSRALFIWLGTAAIAFFHPVLYLMGAWLIYKGIDVIRTHEEAETDFRKGKIYRLLKRMFGKRLYEDDDHGGLFTKRVGGILVFTTAALVLFQVEMTDLVFSLDSIPAVLGITLSFFIAFTSNMNAVMGLRSLYAIVEKVLKSFPHLNKGVGAVLVFIGLKMYSDIVNFHLSPFQSMSVIGLLIGGAMLYSVIAVRLNWSDMNPKYNLPRRLFIAAGISKEDGLVIPQGVTRVKIALSWDQAQTDAQPADLDLHLIPINDGVAIPTHVLSYVNKNLFMSPDGSLTTYDGSLYHGGDCLFGEVAGDDEVAVLDFEKLPEEFDRVAVVVNIYNAKQRGQSFKDIKRALIQIGILGIPVEEVLGYYNLQRNYPEDNYVHIGSFVRERNGKDTWKFTILELASEMELAEAFRQYSYEVEPSSIQKPELAKIV